LYLRFCGINGPVCSAFKDEKGERERENPSAKAAFAARERQEEVEENVSLGGKGGENSKKLEPNGLLCAFMRVHRINNTNAKSTSSKHSLRKNARVPFNLPNSGRLCGVPCFLNRTKIRTCLKESV
jgi:hypothetical protein